MANKTEAFDPPLLPEKKRKSAIEEIYDLSVFLEKELPPHAVKARRNLEADPKAEKPPQASPPHSHDWQAWRSKKAAQKNAAQIRRVTQFFRFAIAPPFPPPFRQNV